MSKGQLRQTYTVDVLSYCAEGEAREMVIKTMLFFVRFVRFSLMEQLVV